MGLTLNKGEKYSKNIYPFCIYKPTYDTLSITKGTIGGEREEWNEGERKTIPNTWTIPETCIH